MSNGNGEPGWVQLVKQVPTAAVAIFALYVLMEERKDSEADTKLVAAVEKNIDATGELIRRCLATAGDK